MSPTQMRGTDVRSRGRLQDSIAGTLLGLATLLWLHRYAGISHDAVLYMGQSLLRQWPGIFGNDLFFLHGSQGRYTLFPELVSAAFAVAPPPQVFFWGGLACLLMFAAACWYCLSALLPEGQRFWGWLGVLALPSMYGMAVMFSYGEAFFTPRSFAETLSLVSVGLFARGRMTLAWGCIVVAGCLHPLQTLGALLVIWPWLVLQDRRWLHALWLTAPTFVLAGLRIPPFDGLLRAMDAAWLADVREFTGQIFLLQWGGSDYANLAFDACLLTIGWRLLPAHFGKWCQAALCGLSLGLGASLVLVDGLHLELPAALQLWRVQWLAHWLGMATVSALLWNHARAGEVPRGLLLMLTGLVAWGVSPWAWIFLLATYLAWPRLFRDASGQMTRLVGFLCAGGMALLFAVYAADEWLWFRMAHYRLDLYAIDRRLLAFSPLALGLPLLGWTAWLRLGGTARTAIIILILLPLAIAGFSRWDARSPVNRTLELHAFQPGVFGVPLPEDAEVYWDGDTLVGTWLVLKRASYFNRAQLAGVVFNRDNARDAHRRVQRMLPLIRQSMGCVDRSRTETERLKCRIDDNAMRRACLPGGDSPAPDFLILPYPQPQRSIGAWSIMDPVEGGVAITYRLYRCDDVLAAEYARPRRQV